MTEATEATQDEAAPKKLGLKALFYKNGDFSKTAMFCTVGNVLVLLAYVLSWGAGSQLAVGDVLNVTLPTFDAGAAMALLGILNGTYIGNNLIKAKGH